MYIANIKINHIKIQYTLSRIAVKVDLNVRLLKVRSIGVRNLLQLLVVDECSSQIK